MRFLERVFDGQNQWWKYVIMFLAVFIVGSLLGELPLILYADAKDALFNNGLVNRELLKGNSNIIFGFDAFPFVSTLFIFFVFLYFLHKRTPSAVINGGRKIRWKRFFSGFIVTALIASLFALPSVVSYLLGNEPNMKFQFNLKDFLILTCLSFLLIPIQSSTEEILVRGYLAQLVARVTRSRWLVLIIPALIFAGLHSSNPEVAYYGFIVMMLNYLAVSIPLGIISIIDDGLECCMGIHSANNIFLSLFFTSGVSVIQTDALFVIDSQDVNPWMDLLLSAFSFTLVFLILYRMYNWDIKVLNRPVIPQESK